MTTLARRAAISAPRSLGPVAFLQSALAAWRQRRALERLDARAMRDLGLIESQVVREASRPAWDVPHAWRG